MSLRSKTIDYYLGKFDECFCGYSNDLDIRKNAASGGIVTQLIIYLLKNKYVDGAIVSKLNIENGELIPRSFIATTPEEVISCQTSIYIDFPSTEVYKEARRFKGKLVIITLPCQLKMLDRLFNKEKIIKIGLFCGHNSKKRLIEEVLRNRVDLNKIERFWFRKGHWRGYSQIQLRSKEIIKFPYFDFGIFQNIFFHMPQKCLYCRDHTAETSDISFGDLWLKEFKKKQVKHSCVVSRQKKMTDILYEMKERQFITIDRLLPEKIISSQKRPLIYHKFTTNALKNIKMLRTEHKCRWNDYIAALLILFNMNIAEKNISTLIYKLPRKLVFLYMVFVRVFLSF